MAAGKTLKKTQEGSQERNSHMTEFAASLNRNISDKPVRRLQSDELGSLYVPPQSVGRSETRSDIPDGSADSENAADPGFTTAQKISLGEQNEIASDAPSIRSGREDRTFESNLAGSVASVISAGPVDAGDAVDAVDAMSAVGSVVLLTSKPHANGRNSGNSAVNVSGAGLEFEVGSVIDAAVSLMVEDPLNAREFYSIDDLDEMSQSLVANGQDTPVAAYVKEGRLWVFDGVKRLKAARSAGIESLRVDVRARPDNDLDIYMISRRMNLERSTQSALDDAVRWQQLLSNGVIQSQQALAKAIGKSEGYVSQVLAINRIPRTVLTHMKERTKTSDQMVAYKISGIFRAESLAQHGEEEICRLAKEMINEIVDKDLNRQEIDRLIDRRLGAPKQRARAEQQKFKLLGREGVFKTFPGKGKIEFTVSGLTIEQMGQVETALRSLHTEAV